MPKDQIKLNSYYVDGPLLESKDIVLKVAAGNPGALEVTQRLQWFSKWLLILYWLERNDFVGARLWELYKDKFKSNAQDLGKWVSHEMLEEKRAIKKPKGSISDIKVEWF